MSLNVSGSMFVRVYDTVIKPEFSERTLMANLVSSRKTGKMLNKEGKEVPERAFSHWEGRFVGNAFEPSKGLRGGDCINITKGWITSEKFIGKDGKEHVNTVVTIAEFEPSNIDSGDDTNAANEDE